MDRQETRESIKRLTTKLIMEGNTMEARTVFTASHQTPRWYGQQLLSDIEIRDFEQACIEVELTS